MNEVEIVTVIQEKTEKLQTLNIAQDALVAELQALEKRYDQGDLPQAELDARLTVLVPRHEKQGQDMALVLAEIEALRQEIFRKTSHMLPPVG